MVRVTGLFSVIRPHPQRDAAPHSHAASSVDCPSLHDLVWFVTRSANELLPATLTRLAGRHYSPVTLCASHEGSRVSTLGLRDCE